jgi:hypothetical protein
LTTPLADLAVTLELLPDRVDLAGFVLMASGLGALLGSAVGLLTGASRAKRAIHSERWSLGFAGGSLPAFSLVALLQGVS